MSAANVLLIEPETRVAREVRAAFEEAGYGVTWRSTGTAGLDALRRERADVVVVDCDITDLDGFRLTREVRRRWRVGIIVVATQGEPADCVRGLESGADDFLRKPFSARELTARVGAVLRRIEWAGGAGRRLRWGA